MTSNYTLDNDGLRLEPLNVRKNNYRQVHSNIWYYEQKNGLYVVVEYQDAETVKNKTFIIPKTQVLQYARIAKDI